MGRGRSHESPLGDYALFSHGDPNALPGGLRNLPHVPLPAEALAHAVKASLRESERAAKGLKKRTSIAIARGQASVRMDVFTKALTVPLKQALDAYGPGLRRLHPFEAVVAELTLSARERRSPRPTDAVFKAVRELRRRTIALSREAVARIKAGETPRDVKLAEERGVKEVSALWVADGGCLDELVMAARVLRSLPTVSHALPTAVLVGVPNVGKSSLVRAVSTGEPLVADYAFTTKNLSVGHILRPQSRTPSYQVIDTPGLLPRDDEERNLMEALTLASMGLLPRAAVFFVIDPTAGVGGQEGRMEMQIAVRSELRRRFKNHVWTDVVTKADLPMAAPLAFSEDSSFDFVASALRVSAVTGEGVPELTEAIVAACDATAAERMAGES